MKIALYMPLLILLLLPFFLYRMRESSAKIVKDAKWQRGQGQQGVRAFDFPLYGGEGGGGWECWQVTSHTTSTPSVLHGEEDSLTWHIMCSKIFEAIALLSADIISPPAETEQPPIRWKTA